MAPGSIWTPLLPATMPTQRAEDHGESIRIGRAGQPAEVAPASVFFASQESSYIIGEMLAVTGGMPVKQDNVLSRRPHLMWLGVTNLRWLMETDLSAPGVMLVAQAVSTILAELGGRDATPGRRTTVKPYGDAV